MKVLITGTQGFFAGQLFQYLAKQDDAPELYGFDLANGQDLRQAHQIDAAMQGMDYCFHLGALTHVHQSIETPMPFMHTNILGTVNVLEACRAHKVPLTYISTSEYYGTSQCEPLPQDEDEPCAPHSPYGGAKAAADRLCYSWWQTYELDVRIVRPFNQYGPGQDVRKVIPRFMYQMVQGKPMTIHGDGTGSRDYVFVQDTVKGIWLSQHAPAGSVMNLGTECTWSTNEVAEMVYETSKVHDGTKLVCPHPYAGVLRQGDYNESRWGHVYCLRGSYQKAKDLIGWEPEIDFETGLHKTWQWFLGQGPILYRGGESGDMLTHKAWEDKSSFGRKPE